MVSVIVPTRNSARTLEACLRSIRGQTEQIELIVIDNRSTDATLEIATKFADLVESFGCERSDQRNRGAARASGSFLLFIDADMRLESAVVSACMTALGSAPAVIIPEISAGVGFWANVRAVERVCYFGDDAIEAARFFPRDSFMAAGGYDSQLIAGEDWDLSDRMAAGQRLPRARAIIVHDEGRLRLWPHLAKKQYYGRLISLYLRKRPPSRRGNPMFRSAYLRNWRTLVRHPLLTVGLFFLKFAEGVAFSLGILAGWINRGHRL